MSSRCDLACRYCYVYTKADQRWRTRPKAMSREVVHSTARRIAEHASQHGLDAVEVIMHGGEPLLAGRERIEHCARTLLTAAHHRFRLTLRMQTNGTLLDQHMLALLDEHDIRVGVSIDGGRRAHDRHRVRADGSGSHALVDRALRELNRPKHRRLFSGLLCTVDLRNDPVKTYESLLAYQPPAVDFLLPHGNWSSPPPRRNAQDAGTPYADWLIAVFDRWRAAPRTETRVRLFDETIRLLLGGQSRVEGLGLNPTAVVVVETDGAIEQLDMLATSYPGAAATGLHVLRNNFDDALDLPEFTARQTGLAALAPVCRGCDVVRVCGGGFYPHRYRAGNGFANPSVYCPDLYRFVRYCAHRLVDELRPGGTL